MQPVESSIENLDGLFRKIKVSVHQSDVKEQVDERIIDFAKNANLKGFRKGKVPPAVIKMQYGEAIRQEAIQEIIQSTLLQALKDQKVQPVSSPEIQLTNIKEDAPLKYEARFEVCPEIKLDLTGITVERAQAELEDRHISDCIESVRKQNVRWKEVERPAQLDDLVVIDFEGFIDNQSFEGGKAKDFRLELGRKQMIPGFEEALIGASKGETVECHLTFPEDYHSKDYAGKEARFVITVHSVMEPELPELDSDFIQDLGVSEGTIEALYDEVRRNLTSELERRIRRQMKDELLKKIFENKKNTVELPKGLIENEVNRLKKEFMKQWFAQGGNKEAPELPKDQLIDQASQNVLLGIIFSQWVEENQIKLDDEKVRQRVEEIASGYHQPQEIINWYYSNKDFLSEIEANVLEDQALDKILEIIEVIDKPTPFEDIMPTSLKKEETS